METDAELMQMVLRLASQVRAVQVGADQYEVTTRENVDRLFELYAYIAERVARLERSNASK